MQKIQICVLQNDLGSSEERRERFSCPISNSPKTLPNGKSLASINALGFHKASMHSEQYSNVTLQKLKNSLKLLVKAIRSIIIFSLIFATKKKEKKRRKKYCTCQGPHAHEAVALPIELLRILLKKGLK